MKQNYFRHIILCLCLLAGTTTALAYDAEIDGICYDFSGNEATVTYKEYEYKNYIWNYFSDYSGSVIIPNSVSFNGQTYSVTSIGGRAFYGCNSLTSVTIPNSVTSIGDYAFQWCNSLTSVNIPNSVTSIGDYAFEYCSSLTSVTIPNSVTSIGFNAFSGCDSLTSVHITDMAAWCGITFGGYHYSNPLCYAHHLFMNGEEITELIIPDGVTSIGNYAFYNCSSLTSVNIPNSVTSIGNEAFYNCSSLTSVNIPNSVTSIGNEAFRYCYFLRDKFINNSALTSDSNWGATLYDEETAEGLLIANHVVVLCRFQPTSVTIPESVTSIGERAFSGCSSLTSVTIPESVTSIGERAFYGCSGLTSIIIPASVAEIVDGAFYNCPLHNVFVKSAVPSYNNGTPFSSQTYYHATLYVPAGSWDAYAYDKRWFQFINIRETVTSGEQLSMQQAYTLMNTGTFAYSVYDPVNDCIGTVGSMSSIDESNPNHCWQVIEADGSRFLYNVGAKKFVKTLDDGSYTLSDVPTTVNMANGSDGIIIGAQPDQWALVCNDRMNVEQAIITGVDDIPVSLQTEADRYDLQGRMIAEPQKGINIIRMSDGTVRKVLVK